MSDVQPNGVTTECLVDLCVDRHVREHRGARPALLSEQGETTYAELQAAVATIHRLLIRNASPGDRVALVLPDSPTFVAALLGSISAGAIAVPLNPRLQPSELAHLIGRTKPAVVFTDGDLAPQLGPALEETPARLFVSDHYSPTADVSSPLPGRPKTSGADMAYCLTTSGTSGRPKLVLAAHTTAIECLRAFTKGVTPIESTDRILSVARLTFGYGLLGNLLFALMSGATSVLTRSPIDTSVLRAAIDDYSPTMLLLQPRNVQALLSAGVGKDELRSVRVCLSAGEPLPERAYESWMKQVGIPLLDCIGATELGHLFIGNRPGSCRPGSAGRVLPGFQLRMVNESGDDCESGQRGLLMARNKRLGVRYLDQPMPVMESDREEWITTGDVASIDADGYVVIHGRADDLIKVGCGLWIDPQEIESLLRTHSDVRDCAVVATADRDNLTCSCAFVVPIPEGTAPDVLEQQLRAALRARWPGEPHKHVSEFRFVPELPRSLNGKISRSQLRQRITTEISRAT
jgi:acyl-coenzyme A synthetase/AMP-(fatty) acid ligase